MSQSTPLRDKILAAYDLLAAYGEANKHAEEVGKDVAVVKQRLKEQYDTEAAAENRRLKDAQDAVEGARKALIEHQAAVKAEYGVVIDLLGGQSGGHVRL